MHSCAVLCWCLGLLLSPQTDKAGGRCAALLSLPTFPQCMQLVHTVMADCDALVVLKSMAGWRSSGFHFRPTGIVAAPDLLQLCFGGVVVAVLLQLSRAGMEFRMRSITGAGHSWECMSVAAGRLPEHDCRLCSSVQIPYTDVAVECRGTVPDMLTC